MPSRFRTTISLLLLCFSVLVVVLWMRSHLTSDLIVYSSGNGTYHEYVTIPGQFRYTRVRGWIGREPLTWMHGVFPPRRHVFGQQPVYRVWTILGIGFTSGAQGIPVTTPRGMVRVPVGYQIIAIPFLLPVVVTATAGLFPWVRLRRRRQIRQERIKRGLCPVCGYDLRASRGRCPECGAEKNIAEC